MGNRLLSNNLPSNMSIRDARVLLETLRDFFDIVFVVETEKGMAWDIIDDCTFIPVDKCYNVCGKEGFCNSCSARRTVQELITVDKYDKYQNDFYHVFNKPIMINGRIYALVLKSKLNNEEDVNRREALIHVHEKNMEIIKILASEYSSVYYIDLRTEELDTYTMNDDTESRFGSVFRNGIKYSIAYRMYVSTFVHFADKAMMMNAGSIENIIKELADKKTFITQYRDNYGFYCEMKFVKVGDETNPRAVALGFANRDKEIRENMERQKIDARNRAVISGLSDDFGCVLYACFDDSEVHYRMKPVFDKYIPGWSLITNFNTRLDTLIKTVIHPDDRQEFYEATRKDVVRSSINRDGVYYINFRILVDDEIKYYQLKFVKDDCSENHVIVGFRSIDDATKRELAALDKAEIASRAKSAFLFNMSHDIRTPMNAIVGFTTMAKKHLDDPERIADYLNKIDIAGNQLLSLINQVLEMSRIESGKIILQEQRTSIKEHMKIISTIYGEQAEARGIRFLTRTHNLTHDNVIIDSDRVKQIAINIVGNALKYTPEGGTVEYCIEESSYPRNEYAMYTIIVKDNGIGMSADFVNHIFDEFSRENTSTVSKIQGTGLGMSIVKKLTDLMSGTINIDSSKGKGTTISIRIPMRVDTETGERRNASDPAVPISLDGMKVLLVEDNEMNREIAEEILSENGVVITTAEDGDIAVDIIRNSNPGDFDLILMDIQMPRMDGYTASKTIRSLSNSALAHIPIVAMTANAFEEDRQDALMAGMNAHLAKPIDIPKLITTLSEFM